MPSRGNQHNVNVNFLYGSLGRRNRRSPSFWRCSKRTSPARGCRSAPETPPKPPGPSSTPEAPRERRPAGPARQAPSSPTPPSQDSLAVGCHNMDSERDRPDYWPSLTSHQEYYSPRPPSSAHAQARETRPVMQPFRTLVALVKRCPWAAVSDLGPLGQPASEDIYYPSVPRSLLHDTAVSFVVKDFTRLDLPEFVISCPFEHVDLVNQLLAPEGSGRQLSARGASGQPRDGDQLRSMLLDGMPSIALALHSDADGGHSPPRNRTPDEPRPGSGGGGRTRELPDQVPRRRPARRRSWMLSNGEVNNTQGEQA
jgi:hypothetical protein